MRVWLIDLAAPAGTVRRMRPLLDDRERALADRRPDGQARRRYLLAHAATRSILAGYLERPPERLRLRTGAYGKPEVRDQPAGAPRLSFNLSHSGEFAMLAVSRGREVGVDIERLRPDFDPAEFSRRYFRPEEHATLAGISDPGARLRRYGVLWTRKEAWVKAAGRRIVHGLRLPVGGVASGGLARDPTGRFAGDWRLTQLAAPAGYSAAVVVAGERPHRTEVLRWSAPA